MRDRVLPVSTTGSMVLLLFGAVSVSVLVHWVFDPPTWVVGVIVGALCGTGTTFIVNRAVSPARGEGTGNPSTDQTTHQRTE